MGFKKNDRPKKFSSEVLSNLNEIKKLDYMRFHKQSLFFKAAWK